MKKFIVRLLFSIEDRAHIWASINAMILRLEDNKIPKTDFRITALKKLYNLFTP